jgi:hypothetical protein
VARRKRLRRRACSARPRNIDVNRPVPLIHIQQHIHRPHAQSTSIAYRRALVRAAAVARWTITGPGGKAGSLESDKEEKTLTYTVYAYAYGD